MFYDQATRVILIELTNCNMNIISELVLPCEYSSTVVFAFPVTPMSTLPQLCTLVMNVLQCLVTLKNNNNVSSIYYGISNSVCTDFTACSFHYNLFYRAATITTLTLTNYLESWISSITEVSTNTVIRNYWVLPIICTEYYSAVLTHYVIMLCTCTSAKSAVLLPRPITDIRTPPSSMSWMCL